MLCLPIFDTSAGKFNHISLTWGYNKIKLSGNGQKTNTACEIKQKNHLVILNINVQFLRKKGKQLEAVIDAVNPAKPECV